MIESMKIGNEKEITNQMPTIDKSNKFSVLEEGQDREVIAQRLINLITLLARKDLEVVQSNRIEGDTKLNPNLQTGLKLETQRIIEEILISKTTKV